MSEEGVLTEKSEMLPLGGNWSLLFERVILESSVDDLLIFRADALTRNVLEEDLFVHTEWAVVASIQPQRCVVPIDLHCSDVVGPCLLRINTGARRGKQCGSGEEESARRLCQQTASAAASPRHGCKKGRGDRSIRRRMLRPSMLRGGGKWSTGQGENVTSLIISVFLGGGDETGVKSETMDGYQMSWEYSSSSISKNEMPSTPPSSSLPFWHRVEEKVWSVEPCGSPPKPPMDQIVPHNSQPINSNNRTK